MNQALTEKLAEFLQQGEKKHILSRTYSIHIPACTPDKETEAEAETDNIRMCECKLEAHGMICLRIEQNLFRESLYKRCGIIIVCGYSQGYASLKDVIWLTRTPISEAEVRFAAEHSYKHGRPRFSFKSDSIAPSYRHGPDRSFLIKDMVSLVDSGKLSPFCRCFTLDVL